MRNNRQKANKKALNSKKLSSARKEIIYMIKILIYDTDKKIVAFAQEDNALNAKEFFNELYKFTNENKLKLIKLAFSEVVKILK